MTSMETHCASFKRRLRKMTCAHGQAEIGSWESAKNIASDNSGSTAHRECAREEDDGAAQHLPDGRGDVEEANTCLSARRGALRSE
jgi:hypothetical protein